MFRHAKITMNELCLSLGAVRGRWAGGNTLVGTSVLCKTQEERAAGCLAHQHVLSLT